MAMMRDASGLLALREKNNANYSPEAPNTLNVQHIGSAVGILRRAPLWDKRQTSNQPDIKLCNTYISFIYCIVNIAKSTKTTCKSWLSLLFNQRSGADGTPKTAIFY